MQLKTSIASWAANINREPGNPDFLMKYPVIPTFITGEAEAEPKPTHTHEEYVSRTSASAVESDFRDGLRIIGIRIGLAIGALMMISGLSRSIVEVTDAEPQQLPAVAPAQ